jgi:hypothetical protein
MMLSHKHTIQRRIWAAVQVSLEQHGEQEEDKRQESKQSDMDNA